MLKEPSRHLRGSFPKLPGPRTVSMSSEADSKDRSCMIDVNVSDEVMDMSRRSVHKEIHRIV